MWTPSVVYLLPFVILLGLSQLGSCYQCYSCMGISAGFPTGQMPPLPGHVPFTDSCIDALDLTKLGKIDCSGPKKACVKSITHLGQGKIYTRGCGDPADCKFLPQGSECHECTEALCNSSITVVPSLVSMGVLSLVLAKYFL